MKRKKFCMKAQQPLLVKSEPKGPLVFHFLHLIPSEILCISVDFILVWTRTRSCEIVVLKKA